MLPGRRTETRSPVLRDLLCGPRVLGEHEVRTSSPHGQTTCPPVGWGKTRWVHEPIYKCESNDGPVQCAKRENLTASCLTRNVGTRSPVRRLVSAVICAREGGVWCHRSAHVAIAIYLVFFSWSLIVCGSSTSLRSAVRMVGICGHLKRSSLRSVRLFTEDISLPPDPTPFSLSTPIFHSHICYPYTRCRFCRRGE